VPGLRAGTPDEIEQFMPVKIAAIEMGIKSVIKRRTKDPCEHIGN
jgi:hypothetical protein